MEIVLAALAAFPLLHWIARLGDLIRQRRSPFRVVAGQYPPPLDPALVSVLIPARDEEASIGDCLAAVQAQDHREIEVLVLDDRSSDRTAERVDRRAAEDRRIRRLEGEPLREGWKGKPNALRQAAEAAAGEWLLMIDADVTLAPEALSTALGAAEAHGADMVSWFADLETVTFWERILQPFIYDFILTHSDPARVNDLAREDAIANGQFILIRASVYRELGGHGEVRASIVEDMAFARLVKAGGFRYRLLDAHGLMRTRMYTSFGEIWRGWTKNFFAGLHGKPVVVSAALAYLALTSLLPCAVLVVCIAAMAVGRSMMLPLALSATTCVALAGYRLATMGRYRPMSLLSIALHPMAALVLGMIIVESARRAATGRPVAWKGREYDAGGDSAALPGGRQPDDG